MLKTLKSLLTALVLLAVPALAHAEEPTKSYPDCGREPTDAEVEAAKGAFKAGSASFNEADYARALDYWEDAYRRDCTANQLLLNLARAYELAGRKRQAVVALDTFLAREPNSPEKDQINRRVDVLKKKIAEEDAAAAAAPPPNGVTTGPATGPTTGPTTEPQPEQRAKRSPWPWVVIGVGAALAVVGSVGYISNKQKVDDLAAKCDNPATPNVKEGREMCFDSSAVDEGNKARTQLSISGGTIVLGAAAVAGGAIWWYLDGKRVDRANVAGRHVQRTALVPVISPELTGLTLSGSF